LDNSLTIPAGGGFAGSGDLSDFNYEFVGQPMVGDGTVVVRVSGVQNTSPNINAWGLLLRTGPSVTAAGAFVGVQSTGPTLFTWRRNTAAVTSQAGGLAISVPYWFKLVRSGQTVSSYYSLNGVDWTQLGTAQTLTLGNLVYVGPAVAADCCDTPTIQFDNLTVTTTPDFYLIPSQMSQTVSSAGDTTSYQVGLGGLNGFAGTATLSVQGLPAGVTAAINPGSITSGQVADVAVQVPSGTPVGSYTFTINGNSGGGAHGVQVQLSVAETAPGSLPAGWGSYAVGQGGTASYANGVYSLTIPTSSSGFAGSGDLSDFNYEFVGQPMVGDGTVVVRVSAVLNTGANSNVWGLLLRTGPSATAAGAFVGVQSTGPTLFSWRRSTAAVTSQANGLAISVPYWLKLVRSGQTASGYYSLNGVDWTQLGTAQTLTLGSLVYVGPAVAPDCCDTPTIQFDNLTVTTTSDFYPIPSQTAQTVSSTGDTTSYQVGLGSLNAATGAATLSVSGMPTGVTASVSPGSITSGQQANVTVQVANGTAVGTYSLTITATSGGSTHSVPVQLNVQNEAPGSLPSGWGSYAVGQGNATAGYANGVYSIGSDSDGATFGGTNDGKYGFIAQPMVGDGMIQARVTGVQGSGSSWVGVLLRTGPDASAAGAFAGIQTGLATFAWRPNTSSNTTTSVGLSLSAPYWVRLVRMGQSLSGYYSLNGADWTQIGTTRTVTLGSTVYVGLVLSPSCCDPTSATFDNLTVSSVPDFYFIPSETTQTVSSAGGTTSYQIVLGEVNGFTGTAALSVSGLPSGISVVMNPSSVTPGQIANVTVQVPSGSSVGTFPFTINGSSGSLLRSLPVQLNVATGATASLPAGWGSASVGGATGSASYNNGVYTVNGAAGGIGGAADAGYQFVAQALVGNGMIQARIVGATGNDDNLYGLLLRTGPTQNAAGAFIGKLGTVAPVFAWRTSTASTSSSSNGLALSSPYWVRLVRNAQTVSGYYSLNGVDWTQISTSRTLTLGTMVYVGLAVAGTATVQFDQLTISTDSDFYLIPSETGQTVSSSGDSASYQIVLGALSGFAGTATLSVSGLPSGITAVANPSSIAPGQTANVTVQVAAGTAVGAFPLTISASSGGLVRSLPVQLNVAAGALGSLPPGWGSFPVGSASGSASYNNNLYTVEGNAGGIGGAADGGYEFVAQALVGNGTIQARIIGATGNDDNLYGLLLRTGPTQNAAGAFIGKLGTHSPVFATRPNTASTTTSSNGTTVSNPYWVRLVRNGQAISGYYSTNGIGWTQISTSRTLTLGSTAYVGFAAASSAIVQFDQFTISAVADFFLIPSEATQTVSAGGTTNYHVSLGAMNGYTGTAVLSVQGLPSGVTAVVSPSPVSPGQTAIIAVQVASGTSAGAYPLTITGTNGTLTHTASVRLTVAGVSGALSPGWRRRLPAGIDYGKEVYPPLTVGYDRMRNRRDNGYKFVGQTIIDNGTLQNLIPATHRALNKSNSYGTLLVVGQNRRISRSLIERLGHNASVFIAPLPVHANSPSQDATSKGFVLRRRLLETEINGRLSRSGLCRSVCKGSG
jgi:uncharacterized membrane protein